jgi:hypothetical protein
MPEFENIDEALEFIKSTAQTHFEDFYKRNDVARVREILERQRTATKKKQVTYTAGEVNAYLG